MFWYHCHSIAKTEVTKMVYKIKCASAIFGGSRHYYILFNHNSLLNYNVGLVLT